MYILELSFIAKQIIVDTKCITGYFNIWKPPKSTSVLKLSLWKIIILSNSLAKELNNNLSWWKIFYRIDSGAETATAEQRQVYFNLEKRRKKINSKNFFFRNSFFSGRMLESIESSNTFINTNFVCDVCRDK